MLNNRRKAGNTTPVSYGCGCQLSQLKMFQSVLFNAVLTLCMVAATIDTTLLRLAIEEVVLVARKFMAVMLHFRVTAVFPHYIMLGVKLTQYHLCGVQQQK